jgi:hypothetical protein
MIFLDRGHIIGEFQDRLPIASKESSSIGETKFQTRPEKLMADGHVETVAHDLLDVTAEGIKP